MDIKEIKSRLNTIRKLANNEDYEMAHSEEDRLYRDVLMTIDNDLAREALKVEYIIFPRYRS